MNKISRVLVLVGVGLLVTGGVILGVGLYNASTIKTEEKTYQDLGSFNNFKINLKTSEFEIKPSEDASTKVVVNETKYDAHTVEVVDNTLTVVGKNNRKWYEHLFTYAFFQKIKVTVYIPEGNYGEFDFHSSTGSMHVPANYTFNNIDINVSTGSVKSNANAINDIKAVSSTGSVVMDGVSAKNIDLRASTGSVSLKNANASEDITLKTSTGGIKLENGHCQNLTIGCSTGGVRVDNSIASDHVEIKTSTGGVKMVDSDADSLFIKTSSGSVNISLLTSKIFAAKSSSGHINVPVSTSGGLCQIETSSGSITATIKA